MHTLHTGTVYCVCMNVIKNSEIVIKIQTVVMTSFWSGVNIRIICMNLHRQQQLPPSSVGPPHPHREGGRMGEGRGEKGHTHTHTPLLPFFTQRFAKDFHKRASSYRLPWARRRGVRCIHKSVTKNPTCDNIFGEKHKTRRETMKEQNRSEHFHNSDAKITTFCITVSAEKYFVHGVFKLLIQVNNNIRRKKQ